MKKRCFSLLQVDAKALLLSRHSITKDLKFSHTENGRVWHISNSVYLNDIGILGNVRIYARCLNTNLNACELVASNIELTDDATYTYFLLFQGNRESINRCFIPSIELNEDNYSQDIADLDERVDAAEGNISTLATELGTAEGNIITLTGNITSVTNRVDNAEEDIANIKIDLNITEGKITTLETEMDTAQGDIITLTGNITSVTNRVDNAEEDIANIKIDLNITEGKITTLETEMDTAQGDISTLQTDLDNKIDRVKNQNGKISKFNSTGNLEATNIDETTIANKIDKVTGQNGKISKFNSTGNLEATNIDETTIANKIDKVTGQNGKISKFNSTGNLEATTFDATHFVPTGLIMISPLETIPAGWLECNGDLISRTTFANLFAAIGTMFGTGDGSTTFKLPDMRGLFVRGYDHGAGVDPDSTSRTDRGDGKAGDKIGTKQADELKTHQHNFALKGQSTSTGNMPACTNIADANPNYNVNSTGGNETRPVNIYMMFIIKT